MNVNAEEKLNVGLAVNGKYIGFLLRLEGILGISQTVYGISV